MIGSNIDTRSKDYWWGLYTFHVTQRFAVLVTASVVALVAVTIECLGAYFLVSGWLLASAGGVLTVASMALWAQEIWLRGKIEQAEATLNESQPGSRKRGYLLFRTISADIVYIVLICGGIYFIWLPFSGTPLVKERAIERVIPNRLDGMSVQMVRRTGEPGSNPPSISQGLPVPPGITMHSDRPGGGPFSTKARSATPPPHPPGTPFAIPSARFGSPKPNPRGQSTESKPAPDNTPAPEPRVPTAAPQKENAESFVPPPAAPK